MDFQEHFHDESFSPDYTIDQWNALIIDKFSPYFRSSEAILENRAMLRVELVNLIRLEQKPTYFGLFTEIHNLYSDVVRGDADQALFELNEMIEENNNTDFLWMSYVNSQIDPSKLDSRDRLVYFFEKIDQLVEGAFRPRLFHLYRFSIKAKTGAYADSKPIKLGNQGIDSASR
jgi:hypothetical protein